MRGKVSLDSRKVYAAVDPRVYGQFLEHSAPCIYDSIWAEMLRDRKFFYSPNDAESPWAVLGGSVEMLATLAYAGEHSPTVWLPGGISQAGLFLEAGREYIARLVVAGAALRGTIEVALCWGREPGQRVTTIIEHVEEEYASVTRTLVSPAASENGRLEIVGHGKGAMRLGAASLMPADNVRGMRRDALDALKRLNASVYRWPGGAFVDHYDWREGVGESDRRPPRLNPAQEALEPHDFGFGEFMGFCSETGAEPFVAVNSSEGSVRLAVDEVRYANDPGDKGPAKLRAEHGRAEPYGVRLWGMGKQQHRTLMLAGPQLEEFRKKHNVLAESLRSADPGISIVCVGGAKDRWRAAILAGCALNVDMISDQCCSDLDTTPQGVMQNIEGDIRECTLAYRELLQTIPEMMNRDIRLAVDRWGCDFESEASDDGDAAPLAWLHGLGIAAGVHQFIRDSDVLGLAAYAPAIGRRGAVWVTRDGACLTAAGHVLSLYRNHFGTSAVAVREDCAPLDVVAAWTADPAVLTIGVVNPLEEDTDIEIAVKDGRPLSPGTSWVVSAPDLAAYNVPGREEVIACQERPVNYRDGILACPRLSAGVYCFRVV